MVNYWLVKTEPSAFSWDDLVRDKWTHWDGVRNYQARNNLKLMEVDDLVLLYHSVHEKQIMGVAKVTKAYYQDPTTEDDRWVVTDIVPLKELEEKVSLADVKSNVKLENMPLVKHSRLSVMPVKEAEFKEVLKMSKTKL